MSSGTFSSLVAFAALEATFDDIEGDIEVGFVNDVGGGDEERRRWRVKKIKFARSGLIFMPSELWGSTVATSFAPPFFGPNFVDTIALISALTAV